MKKTRKPSKRGDDTRQKILETGLQMWEENSYSVNAYAIARRLGMVHGTVMYHFPYGIREAVAEYALEVKNSRVIAQLIVESHPSIRDMSPTERTRYLSRV